MYGSVREAPGDRHPRRDLDLGIFPAEGAEPYKRDLNNLEFHLLDTGHFALEEDGDFIASRIREILTRKVQGAAAT